MGRRGKVRGRKVQEQSGIFGPRTILVEFQRTADRLEERYKVGARGGKVVRVFVLVNLYHQRKPVTTGIKNREGGGVNNIKRWTTKYNMFIAYPASGVYVTKP